MSMRSCRDKQKWGVLSGATVVALLLAAGCTPSARQDVGAAGADLDRAAAKSTQAAGQAVDKEDQKITTDAKSAGHDIKKGWDGAVQGTEKVAAKADSALDKGAQVAVITPKVKMAILRDDSVKITDLNIDTHADTKQVVVNGTASNAASHGKAIADAEAAVGKDAPGYKVIDRIQGGGSTTE